MNDNVKSIFSSKTFWGAIIAVGAGILSLFGYHFATEDQSAVIEIGTGIAAAVGGVVAIYGRVVASKKIGSEEPLS